MHLMPVLSITLDMKDGNDLVVLRASGQADVSLFKINAEYCLRDAVPVS